MAFSALPFDEAYEVDESSRVAVTSTTATFTGLVGTELAWLHWDPDAAYGGTSGGSVVTVRFKINVSAITNSMQFGMVGFVERPAWLQGFVQTTGADNGSPSITLQWAESSSGVGIFVIREQTGSAWSQKFNASPYNHATGTDYYVTFEFDPALDTHGRATCTTRTGSHGGTVVETVTKALAASHPAWDYIQGPFGVREGSTWSGRSVSCVFTDMESENVGYSDSSVIDGTSDEQDFSDLTEVDPDSEIAITTGKIVATGFSRGTEMYAHKSITALTADWTARGRIKATATDVNALGYFLTVGTQAGTPDTVDTASESVTAFGMRFSAATTNWRLYIQDIDAGTAVGVTGTSELTVDADHWFKVTYDRNGGGSGVGAFSLDVTLGHPEALRIETITRDHTSEQDFDVIQAFSAHGTLTNVMSSQTIDRWHHSALVIPSLIDTREKRMNAARVARPWMRARHAVGATDQQSRIGSSNAYGGNALSPPGGGFQVAWARGANVLLQPGVTG